MDEASLSTRTTSLPERAPPPGAVTTTGGFASDRKSMMAPWKPFMKESRSSRAATPMAIPAMESEETILTTPECDRLQICRNATGSVMEPLTRAA